MKELNLMLLMIHYIFCHLLKLIELLYLFNILDQDICNIITFMEENKINKTKYEDLHLKKLFN